MFLITTPEPVNALSEDPMTLRKLVRVCAIVQFAGSLLQEAGKTVGLGMAIMVSGGVMLLVGIVAHFGFFIYLRRFALRIPDESLATQTRTVMWGLVVSMTLVVAFGIVAVLTMGRTVGMPMGGAIGTGTSGNVNLSVAPIPVMPGAPVTPAAPGAPAAPVTRPSPLALMGLGLSPVGARSQSSCSEYGTSSCCSASTVSCEMPSGSAIRRPIRQGEYLRYPSDQPLCRLRTATGLVPHDVFSDGLNKEFWQDRMPSHSGSVQTTQLIATAIPPVSL